MLVDSSLRDALTLMFGSRPKLTANQAASALRIPPSRLHTSLLPLVKKRLIEPEQKGSSLGRWQITVGGGTMKALEAHVERLEGEGALRRGTLDATIE